MASTPTSTRGSGGVSIFGRERELSGLYQKIDGLPDRGEALLLRGEAGIGKSVLLGAACHRARESGVRVLRTAGVQSESELPFAGLHQLLMPLLDDVKRLPAPQREALLAAFGMDQSAQAPDRFMIGLAVLELLSDAAERSPVLVVADDAQWLDPSTAAVLGFVARRIEHEPVGMMLATRVGEADPFAGAGLPEMVLGGLEERAAGELLDAQGRGLTPGVRGRLLAEASGNPLALVELPVALSRDELGGRMPLPAPLPLTSRLERVFAVQADALPAATRALLLVASADDGEGSLGEILRATGVMGGAPAAEGPSTGRPTAEDLAPAIASRLVDLEEGRVVFRHPLVRSAVHQSANLTERRAAHAALAEILGDQPDRQAWHRAADLVGPDEGAAGALEEAAKRARRRGAVSTAIGALERSVGLSEDGRRRGRRLLETAELAFETGRRDLAHRLLAEALRLEPSAAERQRIFFMRQWFFEERATNESDLGGIVDAADRLLREGDPATATNLLRLASARGFVASAGAGTRGRIVGTSRKLALDHDDPRLLGILAFADPVRCGAEVIGAISGIPPDAGGDAEAARLLGQVAWAVGADEISASFLSSSIDGLRAQGRVALLATAVTSRAHAYWGLDRWDLAASDADEGRRIFEDIGHPVWVARAVLAESLVAAVRGQDERVEELVEEVERLSLPRGLSHQLTYLQWARGLAALGKGGYEEAYEHFTRAFRPGDPAHHHSVRHFMIGDLAEAARGAGRGEQARALLPETEAALAEMASPDGRLAVEHARAMLAGEGEALGAFEHALDAVRARRPFVRARLQLALGAWLRRDRRVVESRAPLRAARETFDALGAAAWSERARDELRASGVESRPRERGAAEDLTPQEMQIARLAASGLSNREIGQRMFLSHRTVGAHLYRAFPKLGVTSRGQLREILEPTPR